MLLGVATFAVGMVVLVTMAQLGAGTAWLILLLMFNGFGQGMVIPLSLNTILSSMETAQVGVGAGAVMTIQAMGDAVGVTTVGVLLFSLLSQVERTEGAVLADAVAHAAHYGHAFALATLYDVAVTVLLFVLS